MSSYVSTKKNWPKSLCTTSLILSMAPPDMKNEKFLKKKVMLVESLPSWALLSIKFLNHTVSSPLRLTNERQCYLQNISQREYRFGKRFTNRIIILCLSTIPSRSFRWSKCYCWWDASDHFTECYSVEKWAVFRCCRESKPQRTIQTVKSPLGNPRNPKLQMSHIYPCKILGNFQVFRMNKDNGTLPH